MSRLIDLDYKYMLTKFTLNKTQYADGWNTCLDYVQKQPVVDAEPVVHGEWLFEDFSTSTHKIHCSVCGRTEMLWIKADAQTVFPYCHCGAKMTSQGTKFKTK